MGHSRSAAGRCPGPSPPRDVHRPLWTLWLLFLGKVCTGTALGERDRVSLPKETRGVMERRTQGLGSGGLAQRGWGAAQGAPGLPGPPADTVRCFLEALLPPRVFCLFTAFW